MTRAVQQQRGGLSLVELLAALLILVLVTGVATAGLAGTSASHGRLAAGDALRIVIARAQMAARVDGSAELQFASSGPMLISGSGIKRWTPRLPLGWSASMLADDESRSALVFDALGCAKDAVITMTHDRGERMRFELRGLSGQLLSLDGATGGHR